MYIFFCRIHSYWFLAERETSTATRFDMYCKESYRHFLIAPITVGLGHFIKFFGTERQRCHVYFCLKWHYVKDRFAPIACVMYNGSGIAFSLWRNDCQGPLSTPTCENINMEKIVSKRQKSVVGCYMFMIIFLFVTKSFCVLSQLMRF